MSLISNLKRGGIMEKVKIAPLSGGFMVIAIIGFFASFYKVYSWDKSWGVAFMLLFAIMLAASLYTTIKSNELFLKNLDERRKP
jgi:formate hydrogenlyase subunit 3/multisubunit Na+/H+ antiporter MnhD subunit